MAVNDRITLEMRSRFTNRETQQNRYDRDPPIYPTPMTQITLSEAQQHLSEIISGLQPGEEVQIIQDNRPIARLIVDRLEPIEGHRLTQRQPRSPGQYEGRFIVPDNFNDPLPDDILDGFLNPADLH
jgi:antitoxin (DNA-binding transcriptional repressor) of toxin-antitoxin stability system